MANEISEDSITTSLSDKDIVMNFDSIQDLCSEWNSKIVALDLTGDRVIKGLERFTSYGINEKYATSLATAVNSLTLTMSEVITAIKNASNKQKELDEDYTGGRDRTGTGTGNNSSGGSNYNYGSNSGSNSDTSSNTTVNNNNEKDEITVATIKEAATINDYIGLSTLLSSIAVNKNSSLDNVLDTLDVTSIKDKILSSVNLNDNLKKILYNADSTVLKDALIKFYKNGDIKSIDTTGMDYLNSYIERIALKNNMTVTELLTNENNKKLLYNELENYDKAIQLLGDKQKSNVVKDIYDGNSVENINTSIITTVRDVVDIIASKNNKTPEEVIATSKYLTNAASSKEFVSYLKNSTDLQNMVKEIYVNRG